MLTISEPTLSSGLCKKSSSKNEAHRERGEVLNQPERAKEKSQPVDVLLTRGSGGKRGTVRRRVSKYQIKNKT